MAKFCSNCGKELDENAAICLNCGVIVGNTTQTNSTNDLKKEKKKGLPTWAIILIVVGSIILIPLILFITLAVTTFNIISYTDNAFEEFIEETVTQTGTIGDTLTIDAFKITLTDALLYDSIGEGEIYQEIPSKGKEYLVFFFDIENISDKSEYISTLDFNGYVDGYTVSVEYLFNKIDGVEELASDIAPGMKTKGYVAFEIDTTWQEFELHFSKPFETDDELVFNIVNEEKYDIAGA